MSNHEVYVPPGGPPAGDPPSREIYPAMGRENIYALLADFYRRLGSSEISQLFPRSEKALLQASEKSAAFFVGLCGGPPEYHQKYGPPRMRARHMPFAITPASREVWLRLFNETLDTAVEKYSFPEEHLAGFRDFLDRFSSWMVNRLD